MSQYRHLFRVTLDGSTHDVLTSAHDFAQVQGDEAEGEPMRATFRLVHAAMVRLKVPGTPSELDRFMDLLDDIDDREPASATPTELPDPTQSAASVT